MNKYELFDNLQRYKKTLAHASQYGKQHYAKIDKYYPDGSARYFWTREEWEAYQKNKGQEEYKKEQAKKKEIAKKESEHGYDMSGYEKWKKDEDKKKETERIKEEGKKNLEKKLVENNQINTQNSTSPTNLIDAKAQANRIDNQKRINDIQEKLNKIFDSDNNEYTIITELADEISKTKEGKEIINEFINFLDEHNGKYMQTLLLKPLENGREKLVSAFNLDNKEINERLKENEASSQLDAIHDQLRPWKEGQDKPERDIADVYNRVLDELLNKAVTKYKKLSKRSRIENNAQEKAIDEYYEGLRHVVNIAVNYENNTDIDKCYDILEKWRSKEEIDPETGLPLKNYTFSAKEDLRLVNPGYFYEENSKDGNNMTKDEVTGYHHNCLLSTIACVLRERGYDVSAGTDLDGVRAWGPSFINEYDNIYPNIDTSITDLSKISNLRKEMEQLPPGTYGDLQVAWDIYNENRSDNFFERFHFSGHSTFFKVDDNGKLHIYDGQIGREVPWEHYEEYAMFGRYYVLNDAEIDIDYVKKNKMIIY